MNELQRKGKEILKDPPFMLVYYMRKYYMDMTKAEFEASMERVTEYSEEGDRRAEFIKSRMKVVYSDKIAMQVIDEIIYMETAANLGTPHWKLN